MPLNTVLLVDGDRRSARLLAHLLGEDGVEVEVVYDGQAAMARLARAPVPAVLLTELKLPGADGGALARRALAKLPGVQIGVLTGYPQLVPEGLAGRVTVHTKPIDYGRLRAQIDSMLERRRRSATQVVRTAAAGRAC